MPSPSPFLRQPVPAGSIPLDAAKFYQLVELIEVLDAGTVKDFQSLAVSIDETSRLLHARVDDLAHTVDKINAEARRMSKRATQHFATEEEFESGFDNALSGQSFLSVLFSVMAAIYGGYETLYDAASKLVPDALMLSRKYNFNDLLEDLDPIMFQSVALEVSMNQEAVNRFIHGVRLAETAPQGVLDLSRTIAATLDQLYRRLNHRHSQEGVRIHQDPITTDISISIFENVDADGEIQDGKKPDEISAYSYQKARIVAEAIRRGAVSEFVRDPDLIISSVKGHINSLWLTATMLAKYARPLSDGIGKILGHQRQKPTRQPTENDILHAVDDIGHLNPRHITFREKTGLLTTEERFALNFRNDTLAQVAARVKDKNCKPEDLIDYILRRKAELRDYYQEENSFYVCRISAGNAFLGNAPGALEVIPGTRPNVNLDEILGSGFAEVKTFIGQIETSNKWHSLFIATSPSKTADKSNVLLIGPQGCGKSEILRAVGGDKKSIGIFAVGSDFLTCWKGEAEKNPKRLFEAANRIQKESKKHVHILIDEIDSVLNKDVDRNSTNLVTEFQNLMDGVVHYPNLSVWGATNHPERIPMPMIRRFSKVLIVGELTKQDRLKLLKHFSGYMPLAKFDDQIWDNFADRLEGATGDVIRKIVDHVWRDRMTWFVQNFQEAAEELSKSLTDNGAKQFAVSEFTAEQREQFKHKLMPYVRVNFDNISESIDMHLANVAIRNEIDTAKATYDRAREFLAQIKSGGSK